MLFEKKGGSTAEAFNGVSISKYEGFLIEKGGKSEKIGEFIRMNG